MPAVELTDDEFDDLLPPAIAAVAAVHFTPVAVAREAARLLAPAASERVLDVGSGAGKFCITAALAYPDATFVGDERRSGLVAVARSLARRLGARNVEFLHGDALELDWSTYAGFYLFNPFGEHAHASAPPLDGGGGLDPDRFFAASTRTRERLSAVAAGTRVVTYHGLGKPAPRGFEVTTTTLASGPLERWLRR